MTYQIRTSPNVPKWDPYQPRWRKILQWLRLLPRARFVMMHAHKPIMWAHPDSVPSLTKLLDAQGHKYTVQPALAAVPQSTPTKEGKP